MRRLFLVISVILFTSFLLTNFVYADVPHLIRFQGKVTDKAGAPLNGVYNITFRIYDAETGGALLWSETQASIPVNNGIFTVLLGNAVSLDLPFNESYWLSMEVSSDGEMFPRQRITSVGYAIYAEKAKSIDNVSVIPQGAIILWSGTSCPEGYTRMGELDGKFIVGGSTYNSSAGGSNTHTHGAGSYAGPSHTHSILSTQSAYNNNSNLTSASSVAVWTSGGGNNSADSDAVTTASGAGPVAGTSAPADSRPEFATLIFCKKD